MKRLDQLLHKSNANRRTVAVAQADEPGILKTVARAVEEELCDFRLFGDGEKIKSIAAENGISLEQGITVEHVSSGSASEMAVKAVSGNAADVLMKGHVDTGTLMKQALHRDYGLKGNKILSHVALFDFPEYEKVLFLTDSAMNISPDLHEKKQIIENAAHVARRTGIDEPLVAPLAAIETVNTSMEATTDAALLSQMNARGQIAGCIVDGPLAFDNAINEEAARKKGITSRVAGHADILVAPDIEVANVLYKSFVFFGKARVAGIIAGARAPIVLTSRSDSTENKLFSLALAINEEE
ncbi:phosphate butyryltransferase [Salimicrobium jeotgali]|uniref:Phosphate butyryltransferase n=2 Tax=Salimicrobium TaxID=351195 RepID=K2G744_9BACI|nr:MULTISPECIES: bifunctional enoyl-CoA hydratase/phosphate acetyltransferase [Salimicrobium]AKG04346.1 phosphate butyryltransferase [Salimicrobium jeotgali]EKE31013.1 phosphate butyryltransferase [Salimicrobium jeotgali]MBM7697451.1 phosphate butyryltransferase [Salimicrobium jeotgali]PBB05061.1 phosphate butyryltransferase [Salimicrobium humidisoli]